MNFSEFILTDGTTKIDFLAANKRGKGVAIEQYTPGRAQPKEGGVWQDSMLAPGRRLVYQSSGNITDTVVISIAYSSAEQLVAAQEELDLMLNKALAYWTVDWQDEPVYIQAMAHGETARRYAIIYGVSMSEYSDPYDQPYAGGKTAVATDLTLGLERSFWMANPPGTVTAIAISHEKHEADNAVFVGNGSSPGITSIYRYIPGSATYSTNLLSASLPYNLLDSAGVAANDTTTAIYFGSLYPFTSLVFDIGTPAAGLTIVWEMSIGSGNYAPITTYSDLRDETEGLTVAGVNIVQWHSTSAFTRQILGSLDIFYWVRARLTSASGATVPTQANRHPYTTKYPYIEIADDQIAGNLDALATIRLSTKSQANTEITLPQSILVGLRSIYRSGINCSDFSAYINMRNEVNPSGVTIDLTGPTSHTNNAAFGEPSTDSPTNKRVYYIGAVGDELDEVFRVNFAASIVRQYYGRYRLFVKFFLDDRTTNSQLRARVKFENAYNEFVGQIVTITTTEFAVGTVFLADLGYIRIPPSNMVSINDQSVTVSLIIDGLCGMPAVGGFQSLYFHELILLPVDEWAAVATGTTTDENGDFIIDIDSAQYPKEPSRAVLRDPDSGNIIDSFPLISNQNAGLHAQTQQRLWFLQKNVDAHYGQSALVSVSVNPRFYNLRKVT